MPKVSQPLTSMGHFTAWSMRDPVPDGGIAINTCAGNDTSDRGSDLDWTWCNPTNRAIVHHYADVSAVSVECLWQGTKIRYIGGEPDRSILWGLWKANKAKRPIGAWAGDGAPLITNPGAARRAIYIPAFRNLVNHWLSDAEIADRVKRARASNRPIFLRDWDTGRGIDRNGPMSHAWVLATWLNTGTWPERDVVVDPVQSQFFA